MWILGVDLGQTTDYTAIAAVEQAWRDDAEHGPVSHYAVRHLERVRGVSYTTIVAGVTALLARPQLEGARLVVDKTGVGAAVADQMREAGLRPVCVSLHGGQVVTMGEGKEYDLRVPKRELVGVGQVLLQDRRLAIAKGLALAEVLQQELLNFKVTINPETAHDSYAAWREQDHDDLVLAVTLAAWWAERGPRPTTIAGLVQGSATGWRPDLWPLGPSASDRNVRPLRSLADLYQ